MFLALFNLFAGDYAGLSLGLRRVQQILLVPFQFIELLVIFILGEENIHFLRVFDYFLHKRLDLALRSAVFQHVLGFVDQAELLLLCHLIPFFLVSVDEGSLLLLV